VVVFFLNLKFNVILHTECRRFNSFQHKSIESLDGKCLFLVEYIKLFKSILGTDL